MPTSRLARATSADRLSRRALGIFGIVAALGAAGRRDAVARDATPAAAPAATPSRRRPRVVNGRYQLPAGPGPVIEATVDRGPLPPMFQMGYTVEIDARGRAAVVETPEGAKATPPTAAARSSTRDLGAAGLQRLLTQLDAIGFFDLPQPGEPGADARLVGGPTRDLRVTLADGEWRAEASRLQTGIDQLDDALRAVTAAAGVSAAMCAAFDTCGNSGTPEAAAATPAAG